MDVDEDAGGEGGGTATRPKRTRRKRVDPRPAQARVERRGTKIEATIKEVVKWVRRSAPDEDLDFLGTVERDAPGIGHAIAAVGERFKGVGFVLDALFGADGPIAIFIALAPSIRVGRAELRAKLQARREARIREAEAAQLAAAEWAAEHPEEDADLGRNGEGDAGWAAYGQRAAEAAQGAAVPMPEA